MKHENFKNLTNPHGDTDSTYIVTFKLFPTADKKQGYYEHKVTFRACCRREAEEIFCSIPEIKKNACEIISMETVPFGYVFFQK